MLVPVLEEIDPNLMAQHLQRRPERLRIVIIAPRMAHLVRGRDLERKTQRNLVEGLGDRRQAQPVLLMYQFAEDIRPGGGDPAGILTVLQIDATQHRTIGRPAFTRVAQDQIPIDHTLQNCIEGAVFPDQIGSMGKDVHVDVIARQALVPVERFASIAQHLLQTVLQL
ncbi:hypothetical protein ACFSHQ_27430 [Gemmobacter lanyuensis]